MAKYLYGAAVQGIQGFIFQTNELRDIIGASELVEQICTTAFQEMVGEQPNIIRAAGNIKHVFDRREDCERTVREFPRKVSCIAPGITFSQAVVELDDDNDFATSVDELEQKLRIQRNRPAPSTTLGLMAIKRAPKTGLPAVDIENGELVDRATQCKRKAVHNMALVDKCFGQSGLSGRNVALNIEDMTLRNDWIAVIHADGNGLGQVVQRVGKNRAQFCEFSRLLDQATVAAAQAAYLKVEGRLTEEERHTHHRDDQAAYLKVVGRFTGKIPMRPVVLSGDDMTIIMRADLAVPYAQAFITAFEQQTQEKLGAILAENQVFDGKQTKLTCCAGIAFIKSSFPFHYGYDLAEQLCEQAKKDAKTDEHLLEGGLAPSCIMFHKVQDSFVESFADIERRELRPNSGTSWKFGPYYLQPLRTADRWTIGDLTQRVLELGKKGENARVVKNHLRQWMAQMYLGQDKALQKDRRVRSILSKDQLNLWNELMDGNNRNDYKSSDGKDHSSKYYPAYDLMALHTVTYQDTMGK